ncbi:MAG: ORC1-type DNA replication protein [Methanoregula sp.]
MTIKDLLMWDESLFRDSDAFEFDYMPDQFEFRDTQMRELAFQIRPALRGGRPLNTVCKGLPGTGKTTSIKKLFLEISESTKKVVPVHINCQIDNTRFAILSQIYRKLSGHQPPASGTSFKQVFDSIARMIQEQETVLVVALDDANYLLYESEINRVLYTLLRSHESYEGTRIGVIVIISDMDVDMTQVIDARVASVFQATDIYFAPYGPEEVYEILKQRVNQGFFPNVISDTLLRVIVEYTVNAGDIRVGLDLLKRAALNAERATRRQIEREDISQAFEVSRFLHLAHTIKSLTDDDRKVLMALAVISPTMTEMTTGEAHKGIHETVKIGYTRFYEIIEKLHALRILDLHYRDGRGRTRLVTFRYEPKKVIEYLQ